MKRTHWLSVLLLISVFSYLSIGCDDDVKKKTNNDNVNNVNNAECGNGILEAGETCDGTALGDEDCTTIEGDFTGGTLACAAGCGAFDTSGCTSGCSDACELDNRVCSGDTLRVCVADTETGCNVWSDTDCTLTSETCQVIEQVAQCASCEDACTLNAEQCNANDDGIEACVLGASGCTEWQNAACPQATPLCELQAGTPTCVADCEDACTLDVKQCNLAADGIETCVTGAQGCTEWQNNPCDVATPECQDLAGVATCMAPNGSGETCADVYTITIPFYTEGTDFTADFLAADMTLEGTGCDLNASGVDAVFAVDLAQDQAIIFAQGGGMDGVIYIQAVCDAAGECLDAADDGYYDDTEALLFEATAAGTYYLIVKSYYTSPSTASYAIAVFNYEDTTELTCDDGFDNDLDDLVDCDDPDCFGLGACTTETVCDDGLDNDNDSDIDCADTECAGIDPCGDENTAERCGDGLDNDNDGTTDCADADCAILGPCGPENTVAFCGDGLDNDNDTFVDCADTDCNGIGACGPENTDAYCIDRLDNDADGNTDCADADCAATNSCATGESCATPYTMALPFRVTGSNFGADYVNNHNFYNTAGNCTTGNGVEAIFAVTLTAGQELRMDETNTSFDAVIRVLGTCTDVNPTCLISSDYTETNLRFTAPADGTYYIVLEAYYSSAAYAYDFSAMIVTASEAGLCADGFDNDGDGATDCDDTECFGQTGCTTELNCSDGNDNDGDTLVDCDDDDCATFIACLGGDSCADALPVTLPFHATGTDITADFTNAQSFTGTNCDPASGVEAVFAVTLTAGQRIKMDEIGALDSVIHVIQPCANASTCLMSEDAGTNEINLVFTAPADGIYYVILEAWSGTPSSKSYDFSIINWDVTEANCADTLDEDFDGKIDCNDPDCFGQTGCTTELNCGDGFDNDDDTFTDCDDLDCAVATACELGEGCANPTVVTTFPYNVTGTNFGADYANDHIFSSATCTVTGGPEGIFAVDLLAGERLRLNETGTLDAQLRVLPACTTTAPVCLLNTGSESNILFTAPADGTYYVVLEAYYSTTTSGYNFTIEKFYATETSCVDGIDNDLDGSIDCADSECAGASTCGPETTDAFCADGIDNDADGLTDCVDTDCASFCTMVFSENFNTWPLVGWTIVDGGTAGFTWMGASTPALTGATGQWAVANSDAAGSGSTFLDDLISPAINLSGTSSVILSFRHYYRHLSGSGAVAISNDGGTNWTNVATYTASSTNGAIANINISAVAGGQSNVLIRFRYTSGWDWYWLIDDVTVLAN